jgi:hypothetical protein
MAMFSAAMADATANNNIRTGFKRRHSNFSRATSKPQARRNSTEHYRNMAEGVRRQNSGVRIPPEHFRNTVQQIFTTNIIIHLNSVRFPERASS